MAAYSAFLDYRRYYHHFTLVHDHQLLSTPIMQASVETEINFHLKTIQKFRSISLLRFVELRIKSEKKWLISVINQKHLHAEETRNDFANQSQYIQIQGDKKGINSSQ